MSSPEAPLILSVDDDENDRVLIERMLRAGGYNVLLADSAEKGKEIVLQAKPDLILLDIFMPGMGGYEFCSWLHTNAGVEYTPVIFLTGRAAEADKVAAFAAGAADFLVKPVSREMLLRKVKAHLSASARWKRLSKPMAYWAKSILPSDFLLFKDILPKRLDLPPEKAHLLDTITPDRIYSCAQPLGITSARMAQHIASFLQLPYVERIDPQDVQTDILPASFCRANGVLVIEREGRLVFALSNPFHWELLDLLDSVKRQSNVTGLIVTEPGSIEYFFRTKDTPEILSDVDAGVLTKDKNKIIIRREKELAKKLTEAEVEKYPVLHIANSILDAAVTERASDIHIEPKEAHVQVRFRVDGDMRDMFVLKRRTGDMLISRFKALSGMDIAERRKPQDGSLEAIVEDRTFKLRLATTSTPQGESLVIRLLESSVKPKTLRQLGMTDAQAALMLDLIERSHGLILIGGPTGSGKTTTIYSLLSQIDCRQRSLVSIEDPVEYHIPLANQQQVNEKAGVTFDTLLKSVVRQDPDIIFLGEIRDPHSAQMALDFASTGHLTFSTIHTSNATTAIFRLERLGISRSVMAEGILAIVAQRLLKKLCPHCRRIEAISSDELRMLSPYTDNPPSRVAHPSGCPKCGGTGYFQREGVYEILKFDAAIGDMVRRGAPISEIRAFSASHGGFLMTDHVVEKVRDFIFAPQDAYIGVLVEEEEIARQPAEAAAAPPKTEPQAAAAPKAKPGRKSILVVEDDADTRALVARFLESGGYNVTAAEDGVDALLKLGRSTFDLILADINMPNLDGFKLLEMKTQKGIATPIAFLTASEGDEAEVRGFELGAADYLRKPVKKEILLARVKRLLERD